MSATEEGMGTAQPERSSIEGMWSFVHRADIVPTDKPNE